MNINRYQQITTNINKYQRISTNINTYHQISTKIKQYKQTYQQISINIQIINHNIDDDMKLLKNDLSP